MDAWSRCVQSNSSPARIRAVLLLGAIPNDHNFGRMGVARLSEEFDLFVLDLNNLLGRQNASNGVEPTFKVTKISSIEELQETLLKLKPRFALDFVGIDARAYLSICKTVASTQTDLVVVKDGPLPSAGMFKTSKRLIRQALQPGPRISETQRVNPSNPYEIAGQSGVFNKLATVSWAAFQNKIDIIGVFAGSASYDINSCFVGRKVWSASEDVHTYQLRHNNQGHEGTQGKIVFLDSPIADGSDWIALGRKPLVSSETYYPQLRKLFSEIEKITGNQIVIAGHPNHINKAHFGKEMGDRVVLFNSTPELIRDSAAVLTHGSTAVSYGVLARKPLIFINSEELSSTPYGTMMSKMARKLKRPVLKLGSSFDNLSDEIQKPVDLRAYARYEDGYLRRKGVTEKKQWDSFMDFVREKYET